MKKAIVTLAAASLFVLSGSVFAEKQLSTSDMDAVTAGVYVNSKAQGSGVGLGVQTWAGTNAKVKAATCFICSGFAAKTAGEASASAFAGAVKSSSSSTIAF